MDEIGGGSESSETEEEENKPKIVKIIKIKSSSPSSTTKHKSKGGLRRDRETWNAYGREAKRKKWSKMTPEEKDKARERDKLRKREKRALERAKREKEMQDGGDVRRSATVESEEKNRVVVDGSELVGERGMLTSGGREEKRAKSLEEREFERGVKKELMRMREREKLRERRRMKRAKMSEEEREAMLEKQREQRRRSREKERRTMTSKQKRERWQREEMRRIEKFAGMREERDGEEKRREINVEEEFPEDNPIQTQSPPETPQPLSPCETPPPTLSPVPDHMQSVCDPSIPICYALRPRIPKFPESESDSTDSEPERPLTPTKYFVDSDDSSIQPTFHQLPNPIPNFVPEKRDNSGIPSTSAPLPKPGQSSSRKGVATLKRDGIGARGGSVEMGRLEEKVEGLRLKGRRIVVIAEEEEEGEKVEGLWLKGRRIMVIAEEKEGENEKD